MKKSARKKKKGKMHIIRIHNYGACPFLDMRSYPPPWLCEVGPLEIDDIDSIPDDCPLEIANIVVKEK